MYQIRHHLLCFYFYFSNDGLLLRIKNYLLDLM